MAEPLISYLPPFYQDVREFVTLTETEDVEISALSAAVARLLDDQFIMTSNEDAIRRRERMLGILADRGSETLSFRRVRLVNRYSTKPPFTLTYLQQRLDFVAGAPGLALADIDFQELILTILVGVENAAVLKEIEHTIHGIKPANLVYKPITFTSESIGIRDQAYSVGLDRRTLLGSWKLGVDPIAIRRNEVAL